MGKSPQHGFLGKEQVRQGKQASVKIGSWIISVVGGMGVAQSMFLVVWYLVALGVTRAGVWWSGM